MQLGMIGLGRMGANIVRRLMRAGHDAVVFDIDAAAVSRIASEGEDLVAAQYSGAKADLRPIYDALIEKVKAFGSDVEIAPKKANVSLRRSKQFALIQPSTKTRVDVGIQLKEPPRTATDRLEASGSFSSMVSHRVRLERVEDIDTEVVAYLREAYERA